VICVAILSSCKGILHYCFVSSLPLLVETKTFVGLAFSLYSFAYGFSLLLIPLIVGLLKASVFDDYSSIVWIFSALSLLCFLLTIALKIVDARRYNTLGRQFFDASVFESLGWDRDDRYSDGESGANDQPALGSKSLVFDDANSFSDANSTTDSTDDVDLISTSNDENDNDNDDEDDDDDDDFKQGYLADDNSLYSRAKVQSAMTKETFTQLQTHYIELTSDGGLTRQRFAALLAPNVERESAELMFDLVARKNQSTLTFYDVVQALLLVQGFKGLRASLKFYFRMAHELHQSKPLASPDIARALTLLLADQDNTPMISNQRM
jgi:hypothetical protein